MKVLVDITEGHYETLKAMADVGLGYYHEAILNGTPIPDKVTNGDVIRTVFPNAPVKEFPSVETVTFGNAQFDSNWWNAPYQNYDDDGTRPTYANEWN